MDEVIIQDFVEDLESGLGDDSDLPFGWNEEKQENFRERFTKFQAVTSMDLHEVEPLILDRMFTDMDDMVAELEQHKKYPGWTYFFNEVLEIGGYYHHFSKVKFYPSNYKQMMEQGPDAKPPSKKVAYFDTEYKIGFCSVCYNAFEEPTSTESIPVCSESLGDLEGSNMPYTCTWCDFSSCKTCLTRYFSNRAHVGFNCMSCNRSIPGYELEGVLPKETIVLERYIKNKERYKNTQNVVFCSNTSCRLAMFDVRDKSVTCTDCGTETCSACLEEKMEGHKCAWKKAQKVSVRTSLWKMVNTKKCPSCEVEIQKNKGCPHMTCLSCGAYFCWKCKGYLESTGSWRKRRCHCITDIHSSVVVEGLSVLGLMCASPFIAFGYGSYKSYKWCKRRVS